MGVLCFGLVFWLKSIVFSDYSETNAWHVLLFNYILLGDLQYMQPDPGKKWSFKIVMCSSSLLNLQILLACEYGLLFHSLHFALVKIKKWLSFLSAISNPENPQTNLITNLSVTLFPTCFCYLSISNFIKGDCPVLPFFLLPLWLSRLWGAKMCNTFSVESFEEILKNCDMKAKYINSFC